MDIAVLSDIHGNYIALQKCIGAALDKNIDTFIFLGDYVGEFPFPQKTMELLYYMNQHYTCYFVRGNKEDYWINHRNGNSYAWKAGTSSTGALQYCYMNLSSKDIDFFESMPHSLEIAIENRDTLLACHGSPNRNNEKMFPVNEHTEQIIEECKVRYILCGHTHSQELYKYKDKVVINSGAVGVSLYSKGNAQFTILHSKDNEWDYEFINLEYNKAQVINDIEESGLYKLAPYWTRATVNLIMTGEISHGTVLAKAIGYCTEETGDCVWYDIPEKYWEKAVKELMGT